MERSLEWSKHASEVLTGIIFERSNSITRKHHWDAGDAMKCTRGAEHFLQEAD